MKKKCMIFLLVFSSIIYAQEQTVKGVLIDDAEIPIPGATVLIEGTSKGAVTDFDGNFSINVPSPIESKVLLISFLGYETKTITIGNNRYFKVTLKTDVAGLDEVVVIGYGSVRKDDLTGSVSTVKAEEITRAGAVGIDQALAGRAPGVVVTQNSGEPGTGASIRIRGISSLNGSEPLYVIDGIPMTNDSVTSLVGSLENNQMSPLSMINPEDVESIQILKDASSTAIYGSRGANGVILITTKQGKFGKGVIEVSQENGITQVARYVDLLDGNQYTIINAEAKVNNGAILTAAEVAELDLAKAGLLPTNDWQRSLAKIGLTSNTNLKFSGGTKEIRYLFSNNVNKIYGNLPNSDYNRITSKLNLTADVTEKFKIGANITYSQIQSGQTNNNSFLRAFRVSPLTGLDELDNETAEANMSPTDQARATSVTNLNTQFLGSLTAEYKFTDALTFKTVLSHQNRNSASRYYNTGAQTAITTGDARMSDSRTTSSTITNTLNFNKKYGGRHNVNAVLGQSLESRETEGLRVSNFGFANNLLTWYDPGSAAFFNPDQVTYTDQKLASGFGRINYSFDNKFIFTLTGRFDGSSKFAANNKWAFFPAAAFAYKLSNEKFIKEIDAITEIKLRVSYGTSGNQAIGNYKSLDQYNSDLTSFNEQNATIYYQNQLPNPDLTWETSTQLDFGLDLGFLKNSLTLTLDYYNKITEDLLFPGIDIPVQSGQKTRVENYGSLETSGFELGFSADVINTNKFSWTIGGNMGTGKTKVKDMAADYLFSGWDPGYISGGTQRLIIGKEIGTFYGYKTAGISQFDDFVEFQGLSEQDRIATYNANPTANYTYVDGYNRGYPAESLRRRPGEQLYEDVDSNGTITSDDRRTIGEAQVDATFGLNNSFSFGGFDFSFFIDSQVNKDLVVISNYGALSFVGQQGLERVMGRWTTENQNNTYPRPQIGISNLFSDRYIEDGSFIRLQNVTMGYKFPRELTDRLHVSSLRVFASATNVAIWTRNYSGFSPDVSSRGSSTTNLGHDAGAGYPPTRLIRLGINLKF